MKHVTLQPFTLKTDLTGYLPIPRELLEMDLPSTAVLLYGTLLDRGTLSRKNRYAEEDGQVYVIYPIDHLAKTLHVSDTAVKRHLRELEHRGLIHRCRGPGGPASHIRLHLPSGSIQGQKCPEESPKTPPGTGRKVPPNNRSKQQKESNYYQHGEDESL